MSTILSKCSAFEMDFVIRSARPADVDSLYRMLCELESEKLNSAAFDKIFLDNLANEDIGYLVVEHQGATVAMASCHVQGLLHHAAPIAEIQEMYVDPALRSLGIGQKLLEAVKAFASTRGATQIEVTSNMARLDTHRFYKREGFQHTHVKLVLKLLSQD